jgi:hypothetical protein
MKEISHLGCKAPGRPVTVVAVVSFLCIRETSSFLRK